MRVLAADLNLALRAVWHAVRGRAPMTATGRAARLRWDIAYLLDRLPGMCWANLVSWALRRQPLREARQDWMCRDDTARNGVCYCGKRRTEANP